MRRFVALAPAVALALSACADEAPPPEAPETEASPDTDAGEATDVPSEETAPPADQLGSDRVMQGQWFAKTERGAPMALFGPPQTEAGFSVRCEGASLVFARGVNVEPGPVEMRLMAGGETRTITAQARTDPLPQVTGRLPADDPFAATLAQAREPIAVQVGDGASFRMPAHETLREVVGNCRS